VKAAVGTLLASVQDPLAMREKERNEGTAGDKYGARNVADPPPDADTELATLEPNEHEACGRQEDLIERKESTRGISFERVPPKVIRHAHDATRDVLKALRPDERERNHAYSDVQMPQLRLILTCRN
jgi:hypothetical protein